MVTLPVLQRLERNRECTDCELHESAQNVCLPMHQVHRGSRKDRVLVCIGEKPGIDEDKADTHFVGSAGGFFAGFVKYITGKGADVDVWAVNAIRCKPPLGATLKDTYVTACSSHLVRDLGSLRLAYPEAEIVLLAMGGPACKMVGYGTVSEALGEQGHPCPRFSLKTFATNNPAILQPMKDPARVYAIEDHLQMVAEYLRDGTLKTSFTEVAYERGLTQAPNNGWLSFDLETFGAVEGLPIQNTFHPLKLEEVDKCPPDQVIQSCSMTWKEDGSFRSCVWKLPEENEKWLQFLMSICPTSTQIVGMNLPFDVAVLRRFRPEVCSIFCKESKLQLMDLAVANFSYSDVRPERSLKDIAPLLRVTNYDDEKSLKDGERYARTDEALLAYNCRDTLATYWCERILLDGCRARYKGTDKLSERALKWWSDSTWLAISLTEAGFGMDRAKLEKVNAEALATMEEMAKTGEELLGGPICGKGSQAVVQSVFDSAVVRARCAADPRLKLTDVTGLVSTGKDNIQLLLGLLPLECDERKAIDTLQAYRRAEKLSSSYAGPLLNDPEIGLVGDIAYPTCFIVPSREKDGKGDEGGTQQARMTFKNPALQTFPPVVKAALRPRFPGGFFLLSDSSQIELRIAALLSEDPAMVSDYREGRDRHLSTACVLFPGLMTDPEDPLYDERRQVGKQLNFLVLYKGGAKKFQETLRRKIRLEKDLGFCQRMIWQFDRGHRRFRQWQDEVVAEACRNQMQVLPITGESRLYAGSKATMMRTYQPTMCNFKIQAIAANVIKSAQMQIQDTLTERKLRSLMGLNIFDCVGVECPAEELAEVAQIVAAAMTCPPYYEELQLLLGRELPLGYDIKLIGHDGHKYALVDGTPVRK